MKKHLLMLLILFITPIANAQNSYLCISDKSTGFTFNSNSKSWTQTTFNDTKYLLTKSNNGWEWKDFGSTFGWECGAFTDAGLINCSNYSGSVLFNKTNLRFLKTYILGYVDGTDNQNNTPAIVIGKCSPL